MQETRQLERRFGSLPVATRKQVEDTTASEHLEQIADRLLTAESLDELRLV